MGVHGCTRCEYTLVPRVRRNSQAQVLAQVLLCFCRLLGQVVCCVLLDLMGLTTSIDLPTCCVGIPAGHTGDSQYVGFISIKG
jgi:hypothetical protein